MNIYVGNLSYDVNEGELRQVFEEYGNVDTVKIISDRYTNRSKGFGFIEMPEENEAQGAIDELNGTTLDGRVMRVEKAKPRPSRSRSYGGGGGGVSSDRYAKW